MSRIKILLPRKVFSYGGQSILIREIPEGAAERMLAGENWRSRSERPQPTMGERVARRATPRGRRACEAVSDGGVGRVTLDGSEGKLPHRPRKPGKLFLE